MMLNFVCRSGERIFSLSRSASGSLPPLHSPSLKLKIDQLLEGVMEKI